MNPDYIRAIARRLTRAQRRALATDACQLGTVNFLKNQGLCQGIELVAPDAPCTQRYRLSWSPLGLAVKAYLAALG